MKIKSTLLSCLALLSATTTSHAQPINTTIQITNVADKSFQLLEVQTDLQTLKPLAQVLQPYGKTQSRTKGIFSWIKKPDADSVIKIIYFQADNIANGCIFSITLSANEIVDTKASPNGAAHCTTAHNGSTATLLMGLVNTGKN